MANVNRETLQKLYEAKGVTSNAEKVAIVDKLRKKGVSIGGYGVEANKQVQDFNTAMENEKLFTPGKVMGAIGDIAGYTAGAVPRLFQGTAGEFVGGVGDVAQGVYGVATGDFSRAGKIGEGIARSTLSPTSGVTKAISNKTVPEIVGQAGDISGAGSRRVIGGAGKMGQGFIEGFGSIARLGTHATGLDPLDAESVKWHFNNIGTAAEKLHKGRTDFIGGAMDIAGSVPMSMVEKTPIGSVFRNLGKSYMEGAQKLGMSPEEAEGVAQIPELLGLAKMNQIIPTDKYPKVPSVKNMVDSGKKIFGEVKKSPIGALQKGLDYAEPITRPVRDINKTSLATQAKIAGIVGKPISKLVKTLGEEALSKMSGLEKTSMRFISDNPTIAKKILKDQVSRDKVYSDVVKKVTGIADDLSESGKVYASLRKGGETIKMPKNYIEDFLSKKGIGIDNKGKLKIDLDSYPLTNADINSLQTFVDLARGNDNLTMNQYLNARAQIDNLIKWDAGKSSKSSLLGKELRNQMNKVAHNQSSALKNIDAEFSDLAREFKGVKGLVLDNSGNLKDGGISAVANLVGKGKEEKLGRLESIMPGITKDIQAVKVLEDIARAESNKVGVYTRGAMSGVTGASAVMGNLPGAALSAGSMVITNPKVLSSILQKYGVAKKNISPLVKDISSLLDDSFNKNVKNPTQGVYNSAKEGMYNYVDDFKNNMGKSNRGSIKIGNKNMRVYNVNDPYGKQMLGNILGDENYKKLLDNDFPIMNKGNIVELEDYIGAKVDFSTPDLNLPKMKKYNGEKTFYHGTSASSADIIKKEGFKTGADLPSGSYRGGGYDSLQNSISLTGEKKTAKVFADVSGKNKGSIIETRIKDSSKIFSMDGIEDAVELEDYIPILKRKGIDAVYIGGGEKELVVLNPDIISVKKILKK